MLSYLLTSRSITLYVLYTLHVMLGSTLIFAGLFTYGVHSSKAMARAASAKQANDLDLDIAVEGNSSAYASHNGDFPGMRRVKSMVGLRTDGGWNGSAGRGGEEEVVKFREVCYGVKERERGTVEIEMEVPGLGLGKGGEGNAVGDVLSRDWAAYYRRRDSEL
ncbi:hypothetical protein CJF32_00004170 [Rutstroemia sp. NJR-2017a WRK4]|nr:hypothetical protein CJF32_00004170 [Rutstroemia sp. NJR-2017a WRK4]